MLGRLRMDVDQCIEAYGVLSEKVFDKHGLPVNWKGKVKGRFDAAKLRAAIEATLKDRDIPSDEKLLHSDDGACKV